MTSADALRIELKEKERKEKRQRALQLRREGRTFQEVGDIMGVTQSRAAVLCGDAGRDEYYRARWDALRALA